MRLGVGPIAFSGSDRIRRHLDASPAVGSEQPPRHGMTMLAGHLSGALGGPVAARYRAAFRLHRLPVGRLQNPHAGEARKVFPDLHIGRYAEQADQGYKGCREPAVQHVLTHCFPLRDPKSESRRQPFDVAEPIFRAGMVTKRQAWGESYLVSFRPEPASACLRRRAPP